MMSLQAVFGKLVKLYVGVPPGSVPPSTENPGSTPENITINFF